MLVEMRDICKTFSGVEALVDVEFDIAPGEVHALVGENGAGKSTLVKILVGAYQPSSGEIVLDGRKTVVTSPRHAGRLGILEVYQELSVLPNRTVAQNLVMAQEPTRLGLVRKKAVRRFAGRIAGACGARH